MITKPYQEIDNIKIFHQNISKNHHDYNAKGLDNLYQAESKHFWFITRKEFILQEIHNTTAPSSNIIEIGAGTGNVTQYLTKHGYTNISVGEMHLNGLKYAQEYGIKSCYQFDLLDTPFKDEFDTVCMFDVLEHIENDTLALNNVHKMLKINGYIVLTVPAHQWLWNREDAIASHKRRYTKKLLIHKLKENNFEIVKGKYFFISITPLLFLRTLLNKDNNSDTTEKEYSNTISMHPFLNKVLLIITKIENKIHKLLPNLFGGSLFIIARKI